MGDVEFKRNKETGILETWKDGKKIGSVITMGDEIMHNEEKEEDRKKEGG